MAKKAGPTYDDVAREIAAGDFRPVYYLMGEEPYYINLLCDLIVEKALKEEERDFNLTLLYGPDTNGAEVVNAAKRYPMMAERQVVVVREAQNLDGRDALAFYCQKPLLSTVLVICHPHGTLDRRTKLATEISRAGIVFESNKIYENQLPGFVNTYVRNKGVEIEANANYLLCEYVGADLSRLTSELDKLIIAMQPQMVATDGVGAASNLDANSVSSNLTSNPAAAHLADPAAANTGTGTRSAKMITAQLIQDNIGISKDYNTFELTDALGTKDVMKAMRIVKYFDSNPKNFALQPTLATLFRYFSDLLLAFYSPVRTEAGVAAWLEQSAWQVRKNVMPAMRNYTAMKAFQIVGEIRKIDGASKGVGGQHTTDGDLLKELVYFILH